VSPIVAALDHPEFTLAPDTAPVVALSLVEAFAEIPDPRKARGIRHGVLAIMLLGACAVLTGARSFAAIAEYAHDTGRAILDLLGVGAVVRHASTIRRVLQDLDPDAVEAAMRTWALAQLADRPTPAGVPVREQRQVLALDGKTVRGAHIPTSNDSSTDTDGGGDTDTDTDTDTDSGTAAGPGAGGYRQPHLVSVLDQASGVVLGQVTVAEKSSEIGAFTTLLGRYLHAAITAETARVHQAPAGQRNACLYVASVALGQLVAGGALAEHEARGALLAAAGPHLAIGAYSPRQADQTITSGLRGRSPPAPRDHRDPSCFAVLPRLVLVLRW
jgi:hypothetical protein